MSADARPVTHASQRDKTISHDEMLVGPPVEKKARVQRVRSAAILLPGDTEGTAVDPHHLAEALGITTGLDAEHYLKCFGRPEKFKDQYFAMQRDRSSVLLTVPGLFDEKIEVYQRANKMIYWLIGDDRLIIFDNIPRNVKTVFEAIWGAAGIATKRTKRLSRILQLRAQDSVAGSPSTAPAQKLAWELFLSGLGGRSAPRKVVLTEE